MSIHKERLDQIVNLAQEMVQQGFKMVYSLTYFNILYTLYILYDKHITGMSMTSFCILDFSMLFVV